MCRQPWLLVVLASAILLQGVSCSKRVLVLTGSEEIKASHSQFLDDLKAQGFDLDIKPHRDSSIKLKQYDDWLYDHLILLAPKATSFGGGLDSAGILEFVDAGHNLILTGASDASEMTRNLALEAGVDFDDKGTLVYDHFNAAVASDGSADPTLVATSNAISNAAFLGSKKAAGPILFKGIAHTVASDSELVTVLLSAEPTAYSHDARKALPEPPLLPVGASAALVSAVQARNNARVLVLGGLPLCNNQLYSAPVLTSGGANFSQSGNREFCLQAARWALQDRGVLLASDLRHQVLGSSELSPPLYRVLDDVEVAINIMELEGGVAKPYTGDDVQVSFVMLNPYVRQPLKHDGNGTFSLQFKVPDVYGVFKYVIDYNRRGYSSISLQHTVPVRPFKHDEFDRFLLPAYPYYVSAASAMAAFFLFGLVFLYSK